MGLLILFWLFKVISTKYVIYLTKQMEEHCLCVLKNDNKRCGKGEEEQEAKSINENESPLSVTQSSASSSNFYTEYVKTEFNPVNFKYDIQKCENSNNNNLDSSSSIIRF
jgi:stress response protein SCP2